MPLPTSPKPNSRKKLPSKSLGVLPPLPVNILEEGWAIDPRTGIKHRIMPKTEMDSEGNPILQFEDFNTKNLNKEADDFLAHIRVPVNQK